MHTSCPPYRDYHWCGTTLNSDGTYNEWERCDVEGCQMSGLHNHVQHQLDEPPLQEVGEFSLKEQALTHVTVGPGRVYGVNSENELVKEIGDSWERVGTVHDWKQIDIGGDIIWGVTTTGKVFYLTLSTWHPWQPVKGTLRQIAASPGNSVWGVSKQQTAVHKKQGIVPKQWTNVTGPTNETLFLVIGVGKAGVWGVTTNNTVLFRNGTQGDNDSNGTNWIPVDGQLKWISSNRDVWGIQIDGKVLIREGINTDNPIGSNWTEIEGNLTKVDSFDDVIRGVNYDQQVTSSQNRTLWEWTLEGACTDATGKRRKDGENWICDCNGCWCNNSTISSTGRTCVVGMYAITSFHDFIIMFQCPVLPIKTVMARQTRPSASRRREEAQRRAS